LVLLDKTMKKSIITLMLMAYLAGDRNPIAVDTNPEPVPEKSRIELIEESPRARYDSIVSIIEAEGLEIDERLSRYENDKLVIHFKDYHGHETFNEGVKKVEERIGQIKSLLEKVEVDSIGLEGYFGEINYNMYRRAISNFRKIKIFSRENTVYRDFKRVEPLATGSENLLNFIATGVLNLQRFDQRVNQMDQYVKDLYGKVPLFGLDEEDHHQTALQIFASRQINNSYQVALELLKKIDDDNPKLKEQVIRWSIQLEEGLFRWSEHLEVNYTNKEVMREHQYRIRDKDWANAVDKRGDDTIITIGGANHRGYPYELNTSVIVIK